MTPRAHIFVDVAYFMLSIALNLYLLSYFVCARMGVYIHIGLKINKKLGYKLIFSYPSV